ncbi:MAG: DUF4118 domain-containing protein [Thermoanaerobaculia bacterium]
MSEERPDPETFLALAHEEEEQARRGKLKVFLGAAAGVGKTFAMLEAAHELQRAGIDVVVGWLDTHGRKETEALLEGLERLPARHLKHRGVGLAELDLDAALRRRPAVILVDELAHTNVPGSRHAKRWQDVDELVAAGIDVYTTVNVQHLESVRDLVGQVTGVVVRETVPDSVLDPAAQIELVDLPPEELLERLRQGKVYTGDLAQRAVRSFFRPGNLIALRELALRITASRVEDQMERYRRRHRVAGTWPVAERLLVAVSSGPGAPRLVRAARRLAERLRAEWVVAYVETPAELRRPRAERARAWQTLRLAETLGARTETLSGSKVAEAILACARRLNVSKIVVGKPSHSRLKDLLLGSVRDELERGSGEIDIYVISGEAEEGSPPLELRLATTAPAGRGYLAALLVTALATAVCSFARPSFEPANLVMVYLLGVVWVASRHGRRPSILASVLAVASFDFFFVAPAGTFAVADTQYLLTFGVMLLTAVLISTLTARLRQQAAAAREREQRTAALYAASRDLVAARSTAEIVRTGAEHVSAVFASQAVVLLPSPGGRLSTQGEEALGWNEPRELAVAQWVYDHGRMAGRSTDTLPGAQALYLPLRTSSARLGVLGVVPAEGDRFLAPDQLHLLEAFANQIALALE